MNKKEFFLSLFFLSFISSIVVGPFFGVCILTELYGNKQLRDTAVFLASNEQDTLQNLHNMADWVRENMKYDTSTAYYYPVFPFRMWRKTRPNPEWVMIVKRGGCEEYATLFSGLARSIGIKCRVVYNRGEDHTWTELLINGSWTHFDPLLQPKYRFNNAGFYERPVNEGGWGNQISCVFYFDSDGIPHEVTSKYTDTGKIAVLVEKNGRPIKNARVIIKSHFLMDNYSNYEKPEFSFEKETNSSGQCEFDLGANEYTVYIEKEVTRNRKLKEKTVISVLENQKISIKINLSDNFFFSQD